MYFLIQGFRGSVWTNKDSNIGGSGLTRINFANISLSTKFMNMLKYYQKTVTDEAKNAIKKLTRQLLQLLWTYLETNSS